LRGKPHTPIREISLFSLKTLPIFIDKKSPTLWETIETWNFILHGLHPDLMNWSYVARFCQNLHPFDCDQESLQKEEEKVNQLTKQVLNIKKSETLDKISSLYHWASSVRSVSSSA